MKGLLAYRARLQTWSELHNLRAAVDLPTCGHGLIGIDPELGDDLHLRVCKGGRNLRLLDHGSLWLSADDGFPVVLLAHLFGIPERHSDSGRPARVAEVKHYASHFPGVVGWLGDERHVGRGPWYKTETTPVLFLSPHVELSNFVVERRKPGFAAGSRPRVGAS